MKAAKGLVRPGRSTGPRTAKGKARSRLNARRHGLAVPLRANDSAQANVESLERLLAGPDARESRRYFAMMAAEAIVELQRITKARTALLENRTVATGGYSIEKAVRTFIPALLKLDRYEARAFARKVKALQCL